MRSKDYGRDVLASGWQKQHSRGRRRTEIARAEAAPGLVVETADGSFCGSVVSCDKQAVTLEDRFGRRRVFPLEAAGFLLEGDLVTLVRPAARPQKAAGPARTASGSLAVPQERAKVARASRIYVEGVHDAELVEKIWGDDLRIEGVVVEYLAGIDHLPEIVTQFAPGPRRRLGVLADHLVAGTKESRIAAQVSSPYVRITGHEFIDIWQAVKPSAVGISAWPDVPRGVPWKEGTVRALGWTGSGGAARDTRGMPGSDTGAAWRRILGAVRSYADLEPGLLRSVEELIDFVTVPG
jgi:DUF3097, C-terminal domain/DUF3097, N-terminal domain